MGMDEWVRSRSTVVSSDYNVQRIIIAAICWLCRNNKCRLCREGDRCPGQRSSSSKETLRLWSGVRVRALGLDAQLLRCVSNDQSLPIELLLFSAFQVFFERAILLARVVPFASLYGAKLQTFRCLAGRRRAPSAQCGRWRLVANSE